MGLLDMLKKVRPAIYCASRKGLNIVDRITIAASKIKNTCSCGVAMYYALRPSH